MKPILTFFCFLLLVCPGFAKDKPPNVVTLLVDDLGYRDIGCYGGPVKTPVVDKLAADGVRFTDFHSGAATCSPSRATFLTGRQHYRAGVYSVISEPHHKMHLLESESTIAEVLRENGYTTAHFGKWHLGMPVHNRENPTPADHGFDDWFGLVNGAGPSHKDPTNFLRNGKRVGPMKGYSCQIVVDEALTWLDEKHAPDAPFFLNLWFNEPHAVIAAPDEIVSQYGDLDDQAAIYNGTIDNTDRAIGRLVAKLKKLGELDNTIIVYSSDNGSYLQERNGELRGKKGSLFEGGHRVPGIIYWKDGIPGGRVADEPAGAVDLLPTLCGLIGIAKPKGVHLDGSDLAPLLTGTGTFKRHQPLFWMSDANMVLRMGDHTLFATGTAKSPIDFKTADRLMKQIKEVLGDDLEKELGGLDFRSRLFNGSFANPEANRLQRQHRDLYYFNEAWISELKKGGIGRVELYDLSEDFGQQNGIAKERPELVARMKEQAAAIYQSVMADAPEWAQKPKVTTSSNRSSPGLSPEDRKLGEKDSEKKALMEAETQIHRLATTKRSVFDAFSYVNRIPDKSYDEETPEDFAGRIFSRLANQEGRILLKAPPGMDRPAYEGFKTFLRYEGTASVGNCSACHTLPDFRDGKSHIVTKAGEASLTPSLRNSVSRGVDLKKALGMKLDALHLNQSGETDIISDEYSAMQLSAEDMSNLIAFLKLLDDVSDERFRELILKATVLDTSSDFE